MEEMQFFLFFLSWSCFYLKTTTTTTKTLHGDGKSQWSLTALGSSYSYAIICCNERITVARLGLLTRFIGYGLVNLHCIPAVLAGMLPYLTFTELIILLQCLV